MKKIKKLIELIKKTNNMGNRITQRIYECYICGKTPNDGEDMWYMGSEIWCKECCEKQEQQEHQEKVNEVN